MKRELLFCLLMACASAAFALDPGVARGTLVIGEDRVALTHATVHHFANRDGLRAAPELRVLVSDREPPRSLLEGFTLSDEIAGLALAGRLRGVVFSIDPRRTDGEWRGTVLAGPGPSSSAMRVIGEARDALKKQLRIGDHRVSGEFTLVLPPAREGEPGMRAEVTFHAPLFEEASLSADLRGASAARSSPALASLEFIRAERRADVEAARPHAMPWRLLGLQKAIDAEGAEKFRVAMATTPAPEVLAGQVARVVIRGNHALVVYQSGDERSVEHLELDRGAWRVR